MTDETAGTPASQAAINSQWDTGRIEAFSDGVFAVAITLLVLEIGVPESGFNDLRQGIIDQWPSYLAYVTSFVTIGGIWLAHHGMFRRLQYADDLITRLNLLLLLAVSFLPFPTNLVAEALHKSDSAEETAVIFFGLSLFVVSLILNGMWRTIAHRPQLLIPEVETSEIARIARRASPNLGAYFVVIVLARENPRIAAYGFLIIALAAVFRVHGETEDRRRRRQSRGRFPDSDGI